MSAADDEEIERLRIGGWLADADGDDSGEFSRPADELRPSTEPIRSHRRSAEQPDPAQPRTGRRPGRRLFGRDPGDRGEREAHQPGQDPAGDLEPGAPADPIGGGADPRAAGPRARDRIPGSGRRRAWEPLPGSGDPEAGWNPEAGLVSGVDADTAINPTIGRPPDGPPPLAPPPSPPGFRYRAFRGGGSPEPAGPYQPGARDGLPPAAAPHVTTRYPAELTDPFPTGLDDLYPTVGSERGDSFDDGYPPESGDSAGADEIARRRRLLLVVGVLAGLIGAVLLPLSVVWLNQGGTGGQPTNLGGTATVPGGQTGGATPSPGSTGSPPASTEASPRPTASASPSTKAPTHPAPTTVTYQAEAGGNVLSGSATVISYSNSSGGKIVTKLGDWGPGRSGTLRFNAVTVPTDGDYRLTFFYVNTDGNTSTAVIMIPSDHTMTVTAAGGSSCCQSITLTVHLHAGANSVTFGNRSGHAPSIDRIMISST
jgi:hypothetical protein